MAKARSKDTTLGKEMVLLCLLGGRAYGGYLAWLDYRPQEEASGPRSSTPTTVELAKATMQRIARTVEAVGTTRARQSVEIVPD